MPGRPFLLLGAVALVAAVAPGAAATATAATRSARATPVVLEASGVASPVHIPARDFPRTRAAATITPTFAADVPDAVKAPVQAALSIWASLLTSPQPITVQVNWVVQGSTSLAGAGPNLYFRDFPHAPKAGTWYAQPLAEALSGTNLGGADPDIDVGINSTRNDWYFGTDGNTPLGQYDLMSVVLHELAHGFGMLGTMKVSGGKGSWGVTDPDNHLVYPDSYDRFTDDTSRRALLNTIAFPNNSVALANALQSGVFFDSPQTNRGTADRIALYSPPTWKPGSSYGHFDELSYPGGSSNALPTPSLDSGESEHATGPLLLCELEAMGWSTPEVCTPPASTGVTGSTWFSDGSLSGTGPSGTVLTSYATDAPANRTYKYVSGLDGGPDHPCMWDTAPVNPNNRVASGNGFIGFTSGPLNRGSGRWQICFREESSAANLVVTAPRQFTVP